MTTTEELVAQVNKLLDDVGIDMAGLFEDFDVVQVSRVLNRNLHVLRDLERELGRRVGETLLPAAGIDRKSRDPHIQWLYRKKRNRLLAIERLRSAITAHRMALAIISTNYEFISGKERLRAEELGRVKSGDVRAVPRKTAIGRLAVLPHLAYSGDVLRLLAGENLEVREAFKLIKGKLRERGTVQMKGMRIEVEYWEGNRLRRDRLDLPADTDVELELRRRYGRRFRWRVLSFVKTKGTLVNNHYTVDNLALAYATLDPGKGAEKLALDIFRYYFLTSPTERESLSLYPGIKRCVDCHYSLLDLPFKGEPDYRTGYGSMLLIRKCEMEGMLTGKRADIGGIPNYLLGGVLLYGMTEWDEGKVAKILEIPEDELVEAIKRFVLSGLQRVLFSDAGKFEKFLPKSERAKRFLALLQG